MKRSKKGKGVQEKYKMLVAEYRKFKEKNVKHLRFNLRANSNTFGELKHPYFDVKFIMYFRRGATPLNPPIGGDLL